MKLFAKRIEDENEYEDDDENEPKDELSPHPAALVWNCKVSFSIWLAFQASGGAEPWTLNPKPLYSFHLMPLTINL